MPRRIGLRGEGEGRGQSSTHARPEKRVKRGVFWQTAGDAFRGPKFINYLIFIKIILV